MMLPGKAKTSGVRANSSGRREGGSMLCGGSKNVEWTVYLFVGMLNVYPDLHFVGGGGEDVR